jgi:enhancing lycopene biosynthesis protein 2
MHGGATFKIFLDGIKAFVAEHHRRPGLGPEVQDLGKAAEALEQSAAVILGFFGAGKTDQVMLVANPFLEIMAEVTIAHLLLEAAIIASGRVQRFGEDQSQEDHDFFQGKVMAAKFFANFVLPAVHSKAALIAECDRSALDIPDGGFSAAG